MKGGFERSDFAGGMVVMDLRSLFALSPARMDRPE